MSGTGSNFPDNDVYSKKQRFSAKVKMQNDEINRDLHAHYMLLREEILKTIGEPTGQKIGANP